MDAGSQPVLQGHSDAACQQSSGAGVSSPGTGISQSEAPQLQGHSLTDGINGRKRVALVFGREELGLSDDEVEACSVACCIPIGRLQESLSLSHAVSIALSGIYAQRLAFVAGSHSGRGVRGVTDAAASSYIVTSSQGLAEGYDADMGKEH